MKKNLYKFLLAFMVIIGLSPQQIIGQCISSFNNPSGTINVSPMVQTIVSGAMNPNNYAVINITSAGEYQVNTSFGTSLNITDNSNVSLASGSNPLNVSFPTAGLYRIHVCSSNGGGSRIVAISPKNRAFDFDGIDDFIDCGIGVTNALKGKDKFTVEAWVYPTQNTAGKSIIGNHQSNTQFDIQQAGNFYSFFIGFGSYAVSTAANTATLNTWQHIAGVFDDNILKIYLNGVLSGTTAVPSTYVLNPSCNTNLWIGKSAFGGEEFQGSVDEVRIWDRAVCQGEIQKNMNGIIPTTATNLLANYHFEHGVIGGNNATVTTLVDYSGNAFNGTVTNAALNGAISNWVASGAYPANGAAPLVDVAPAYTAPAVSISGANGICNGASTTFTASGNVSTYNWLSGPTTATNSVSPTTTTTYSVVGTNSLGCLSNTATITLTVSSISTSSAVTNVPCNGGTNGSATVTASGGISPYTYLASNGSTLSVQPGLMAGTYTYTITDNIGCTKSQALTITQPAALVTSTAVTNVSCNGGSTGSATLTVSGGTTPYSYMASNGYTTATLPSLVAGTYNYTVTDANSCIKTQALTITQPTALSLTASANNATICSGSSSTLTANGTGGTGTITYTWVGGPTNSIYVVSPTSPTNYTVNIADANNCTKSETVGVVANVCSAAAALNFDGTNDHVDCGIGLTNALKGLDKMTVEAWLYPTQNTAGKSVVGNHQSNTQFNIQQTTNNQYSFFIGFGSYGVNTPTNSVVLNTWQHVAGVFDDNVIKIYLNGVLSGTTAVPSTYVLNPACATNVWIGKSAFGGENFQGNIDEVRIWNIARTQCEINTYKNCEIPTSASGLLANYHFNQGNDAAANPTVTTLIDASASAFTGTLTNMALTGTTSNWVAPGGVASGFVTPANLTPTVSVNSGAVCTGQSFTMTPAGADMYAYSNGSNVATPTSNDSYTVTGTSTVTGCSNTAVSSVTVNSLPTISVNSGSICVGQSFTLVPTGANTYTYSNGTDVVMPTANDSYTVTGTDANGCENTAVSSVTVNTLPTVTVNSGSICAGQSFTMTPSGAVTYTYSNGTDIVTPTVNDSYTVTGADANGCENTAVSSVIVNTLPVLTAVTNNTLLCVGQTATLSVSGAATYTWSTTENTTSVAVSPTVQTTYTVNGTDANGCENTTTVTQNISACTGIATLSNDAAISVYPNPNHGLFVIELTSSSIITVTNALGQVVMTETFEPGKHTVNISSESTGVYFVKMMTNNKQQIIKVIKE